MHAEDVVKRVMALRAEVVKQLNAADNSPVRVRSTGLFREDEAIVAEYTHAAVLIDVGADIQAELGPE